ncbi:hypothetical protein [Nonomuraea rosea]|uniref:hypothetical protein n=1 Tax=Nonomuraea rosea TaxID=638574 RepID=UPI0031E801D2
MKEIEKICSELGLFMTAALTGLATEKPLRSQPVALRSGFRLQRPPATRVRAPPGLACGWTPRAGRA